MVILLRFGYIICKIKRLSGRIIYIGKMSYKDKENIIRDKINMDCISLNYSGHRVLDTTPTEEDFKKTVSQYLSWKISAIMSNTYNVNKDV